MPQRRTTHPKKKATVRRHDARTGYAGPSRSARSVHSSRPSQSSTYTQSRQAQSHHTQTHRRSVKRTNGRNGSSASNHSQALVTRRRFLFGALGIGAVAVAAAGGVTVAMQLAGKDQAEEEIDVLRVSSDSVFTSDDCTELDPNTCMTLSGSFDLPYGSLVWASSAPFAACLLPTEGSADPLCQVALLDLTTGAYPVILAQAVSHNEGFDIYDVRASDAGLIWTEVNILDEAWRIFAAPLVGGTLGEARQVDEGDKEWEVPTIAAVGSYAFWQVLPHLDGSQTAESSLLKKASFAGGSAPETIYASTGRMCTPPYAFEGGIVITPRTNTSTINYQLTLLDAESNAVLDKMVLPQSMRPLEAGYGANGFMFSFDGIYDYGDGISNLGTYSPAIGNTTQNYNGISSWFRFARTPSAPPAWCGKWLIVKSTRSVCGVDLEGHTYFPLATESGSDSYGDYLATTGSPGSIVTFSNINNEAIDGTVTRLARVRVWTPIA